LSSLAYSLYQLISDSHGTLRPVPQ
jgi:hypothetical protein